MKKELEKKIAVNIPNPEPQIVKVKVFDTECLLQDRIPYEDWQLIYERCLDEYLHGRFDIFDVIMKKVILDEYTNIDTSEMDGWDITSAFDYLDMDCEFFNDIRDKLYRYMIDEEVYSQTQKALREFFNEDVSVNLAEQLKEDISSFDVEKLKELTNLFIETKIK